MTSDPRRAMYGMLIISMLFLNAAAWFGEPLFLYPTVFFGFMTWIFWYAHKP